MGFTSIWHWVIVLVVVLLLFGAGKIPRLMGDVAKGVNAFKKGLRENDEPSSASVSEEEDSKALEGSSSQKASMQKDKDRVKS